MKLSYQLTQDFGIRELDFVKQLGLDVVSVNLNAPGPGDLQQAVARITASGLQVGNIADKRLRNMPEVTLNLPGRDERITAFAEHLREIADLGMQYMTYAHMGNGIWTSPPSTTRGGAVTRSYSERDAYGFWIDDRFHTPLSHGRTFSEQEIWDNLFYFLDRVLPVAENLGIRIGVHPDDPPQAVVAGVPRPAFSSLDGYVRVFDTVDSPALGACLCVGTWLEGGSHSGDVLGAIEEFARRGKLWKIHLRNVSAPLPEFTETFIDDGYGDIRAVVSALDRVGFDGLIIADHVPTMVGGDLTSWAFAIGYIKGLISSTGSGL